MKPQTPETEREPDHAPSFVSFEPTQIFGLGQFGWSSVALAVNSTLGVDSLMMNYKEPVVAGCTLLTVKSSPLSLEQNILHRSPYYSCVTHPTAVAKYSKKCKLEKCRWFKFLTYDCFSVHALKHPFFMWFLTTTMRVPWRKNGVSLPNKL